MAITQDRRAQGTQAWEPQKKGSEVAKLENTAKRDARPFQAFMAKVSADAVFNLAGNLAYSFLVSIIPLLLVLLAVAGLVIGSLSPAWLHALENGVANALPSGIGPTVIHAATSKLSSSAGVILIIGILSAIFAGSRLFVVMEFCLSVIYRIQQREFLQQNIVAILMTLAFVVAGPIVFLASSVPTAIISHAPTHSLGIVSVLFFQLLGLLIAFGVAFAFFAIVYYVVTNRHMLWREVWKGAAVAAGLLVIYELLFPLYESFVLKPGSYGSLAGFLLLLLAFFYYLSVIFLLGAEINAWATGIRDAGGDFMTYLRDQARLQQERQAQKHVGKGQIHKPAHKKVHPPAIGQPTQANNGARPAGKNRHGTRRSSTRRPATRQTALTATPEHREGLSLTATILGGLTALGVLALQWRKRTRAA